ncbi:C40 family peptidase [Streptomyces sp. NPDC094448]|uniref:C40 family peptidase n=1 Tax=Streptomyces sp. NPDC094448 TaxID=3366063 RepID=UPI00382F071C
MSGRMLRAVCTAALAAVTTVAAVPVSAASAGTFLRTGAAPALPAVPEPEAPAATVPELLTRLGALYREAEAAAAAYTAAESRLTAQRAETARLGRELTAARDALATGRDAAGRLAREQYRGHSNLSSSLRLLLARDPQAALDQGHLLRRAAADRLASLDRLAARTRRAEQLAASAKAALDAERALAAEQQRARETADERLAAVEQALSALTPEQLEGITSPASQALLAGPGALGAPSHDPGSTDGTDGANGGSTPLPTAEGERAVRYAVEQIGKPYEWGARGPDAYDCSGLTSEAWSSAGRAIPRTSQEQWRELPRVPVGRLRPGDLVVYFAGATHVGLYLGDGRVVHAPRPGAPVKVSPLAANPVLGAVRPDPGSAPLPEYTPPELPEAATDGPDAGYSSAEAP